MASSALRSQLKTLIINDSDLDAIAPETTKKS
jgi:hypothetical protein